MVKEIFLRQWLMEKAMKKREDDMLKIGTHYVNGWDLLMWAGAALAIASDVIEWVGHNATILLGIGAFAVGLYKSVTQASLIRQQRKTERLTQEKLKREIEIKDEQIKAFREGKEV